MAPKFIPFEEVEALADIERLAQMLNLSTHGYGTSGQLRCVCPVHGGGKDTLCITPDKRSRRGSLGVYFCQANKDGGDRIGLVAHCMELGQQDAAFFIHSQFGAEETVTNSTVTSRTVSKERATVPQKQQGRTEPQPRSQPPAAFDAEKFAASLVHDERVAAVGLSKQMAETYRIGTKRKKLYLPICPPDVTPAGWAAIDEDGNVHLPDQWLASNVVPLKRPA